jgi:AAA domain
VDELLNFDRFNDETSLIGDRWLCEGKQAVLQGPTDVGKSSLVMQWAIRLCLGLAFFGIKPVRAMRVLIIQAENDLGDMAEAFQDMTDTMSKFAETSGEHIDVDQIRENLSIVSNDTLTAEAFIAMLKHRIQKHKPDVVFVDPLLAYIGGDMLKQEVMSKFLRNWVNPVLHETKALLIWIHHISKPGGNVNGQEKSEEQNKYSGLGSSELQNACREVINLSSIGDGLFKLSFTKRGGRLGLKDREGKPIREFNIEHGKDGIMWFKAEGAKSTANRAKAKNIKAEQMVRAFIVDSVTVSDPTLRTWAGMAEGVGINAASNFAKSFAEDPASGIYYYKAANDKSGRRPMVYSTIMPDWMKEARAQEVAKEQAESESDPNFEFFK